MLYYYDGLPESAYYATPTSMPKNASLAFNFVGLGLPMPVWKELTSLLKNNMGS